MVWGPNIGRGSSNYGIRPVYSYKSGCKYEPRVCQVPEEDVGAAVFRVDAGGVGGQPPPLENFGHYPLLYNQSEHYDWDISDFYL